MPPQIQRCKAERAAEEEEEGSGEFVCPDNVPVGIFSKHAHPDDCRQYFVCIAGTPREYGCPLGTVFKVMCRGEYQSERFGHTLHHCTQWSFFKFLRTTISHANRQGHFFHIRE